MFLNNKFVTLTNTAGSKKIPQPLFGGQRYKCHLEKSFLNVSRGKGKQIYWIIISKPMERYFENPLCKTSTGTWESHFSAIYNNNHFLESSASYYQSSTHPDSIKKWSWWDIQKMGQSPHILYLQSVLKSIQSGGHYSLILFCL